MSFLQRLAPRGDADGFWSGLPVGGALGFVYAPCAGPILAAVISVSASSGTTGRIIAVAVAYGLGSALVLLGLALGGRKVIDRVRSRGRGPGLQRGFGAVMLLTAVLMFTSVDLRFQEALASHFPSFLTNPTGELEKTKAVEDQLAKLRGEAKFKAPSSEGRSAGGGDALPGVRTPELPVLGPGAGVRRHAALVQHHAADDGPPARPRRARRLLDVHLHQLPAHAALHQGLGCRLPRPRPDDRRRPHAGVRLRAQGHQRRAAPSSARGCATRSCRTTSTAPGTPSPTRPGPRSTSSTRAAGFATCTSGRASTRRPRRRSARSWPRRAIAASAALPGRAARSSRSATAPRRRPTSAARGRRASPRRPDRRHRTTTTPPSPPSCRRASSASAGAGTSTASPRAPCRDATITARVVGRNVYLVLSSEGDRARRVRVELDGRPIAAARRRRRRPRRRGHRPPPAPVPASSSLGTLGEHVLTLRFDPRVSGFAFTFG